MNIIVKNNFVQESDKEILFGDEEVTYIEPGILLPNMCVQLGLFKSTSQARNSGRTGEIPQGWTAMKGNKKTPIWIWNPSE